MTTSLRYSLSKSYLICFHNCLLNASDMQVSTFCFLFNDLFWTSCMPIASITTYVLTPIPLWVPNITLKLDHSLGQAPKSCYPQGHDLVQRKVWIKVSKGKRHMGQTQRHRRNHTQASRYPLSMESQQCVTIPVKSCQPGKLIEDLVSRVFTGSQSHRHEAPM